MKVVSSRRCLSLCQLLPLFLFSGCATVGTDFSSLMNGLTGNEAEAQAPLPPGVPYITVVMVAEGESPVSKQYPIPQVTYIQNVLESTGLQDRFPRMDVELYRPLAEGNHRLEIEFDRVRRQVPPSYDYALRPGDRLVVSEDTSTMLDDMLGSLSLPFK